MSRLYKGINWLAAGILGWAGLVAWLQPISFFGDPDWASPVVMGSLTLAALILLNGWRRWMKRWSAVTYRRVLIGLAVVIVVTQLVVAFSFVDVSRADAYFVRSQAIALAQGHRQWAHYFLIYPNNVNFTLLEAALIKILKPIFGTPWIALNVLRFLWVDTGLLSGLYLLRRWQKGRTSAFWLMLFWLLSAPVYAYSLYAYTDALVMPLALNILALVVAGLHHRSWRRWSLLSLAGFMLAVGVAMKSNLIVFWIALAILVLALWQQHQINWRTVLGWLFSMGLTLGIVFALMGAWKTASGYRAKANDRLPVTGWIAMSLNPYQSGQYNLADFQSVNKKPTAAAKQRQTTKMIKSRLKEMGATGFAVHLAKKMRVFFATGDFDSFKLTTQWIKAPRQYVTRQRNIQFWIVLMNQVLYLTVLIETIGWLITSKTFRAGQFFLTLTLLGLAAFHVLFWEVEARYALPLLPGLFVMGAVAIGDRPAWALSPRMRRLGPPLISGLALFSLLSLWQTSQHVHLATTTAGQQGNGSYVQRAAKRLAPGAHVTQTLHTRAASNQVNLSPIGRKTSPVKIELRAAGEVIYQRTGQLKKLKTLRFPTTKAQTLTLTIKNVGQRPVRYGAMVAPYSPQTGKITARNHTYLQYYALRNHRPQTLTNGLLSTILVVVAFGATLIVYQRLPDMQTDALNSR